MPGEENPPGDYIEFFASDDLPEYRQRIEEFEGREHQRTLVPVTFENGEVKHCYIYALHERMRLREDQFENRSNHTSRNFHAACPLL